MIDLPLARFPSRRRKTLHRIDFDFPHGCGQLDPDRASTQVRGISSAAEERSSERFATIMVSRDPDISGSARVD